MQLQVYVPIGNPLPANRVKLFFVLLGYVGLSLGFAVGHFFYNSYIGYLLFDLSGGVRHSPTGWTALGGIGWAWTTPIYLPGGMCLAAGFEGPAAFLIFGASLLTGWVTACLLISVFRHQFSWGRRYWRLWFILLAWGWVIAPAKWTWIWQITVRY